MANSNLNKAKAAKNDEFYTKINDIENELNKHKKFLRDKHIFMPCDDPELMNNILGDSDEDKASKFWVFFHKNFERLGLKKISATHYSENGGAYLIEYSGGDDANIMSFIKTNLKGDGDFRSEEVINLIKNSDAVVTNPPFSLFREFVKLLTDLEMTFIIIGPKGAISYKDYFPLVKDQKVWAGYTNVKEFIMVDEERNVSIKKFGNIGWWTNVDTTKRREELFLFKEYNPETYPKYDNYDAISVDRIKDIPVDYFDKMGVPTSFIDQYNPDQFELIGIDRYLPDKESKQRFVLNGREKFARLVIRRKK